jgi:hypothetical protein
MSQDREPRLVLRQDRSKVAPLQRSQPLTIGSDRGNRLCLPTTPGVAPHHAVVKFSRSHGWLVCDWGSPAGTFLEGQRIRQCRLLHDGDEIQLGPEGPVLLFVAATAAAPPISPPPSLASPPAPPPGSPTSSPPAPPAGGAAAGGALRFAGRPVPLDHIRSVHLRSRRRHPHSFSWWLLIALGGLVLLPWPLIFWGVEIGALAAWILLGSRREHVLVVTLRDGMAHRHSFENRMTALAHRNGIRSRIGQSLED